MEDFRDIPYTDLKINCLDYQNKNTLKLIAKISNSRIQKKFNHMSSIPNSFSDAKRILFRIV